VAPRLPEVISPFRYIAIECIEYHDLLLVGDVFCRVGERHVLLALQHVDVDAGPPHDTRSAGTSNRIACVARHRATATGRRARRGTCTAVGPSTRLTIALLGLVESAQPRCLSTNEHHTTTSGLHATVKLWSGKKHILFVNTFLCLSAVNGHRTVKQIRLS